MSLLLRISVHPVTIINNQSQHKGLDQFSCSSYSRVHRWLYLQNSKRLCISQCRSPRFRSINGDGNDYSSAAADNCSTENEGLAQGNESRQGQPLTSNEVLSRLRRYGISGILSYGLLNTAYYLTTFLVVWFYVAPTPGKMGYFAAVQRFIKVMAMVWAGSQVTKLLRAGGALAVAPIVDRGLSWFTVKFNFKSQGKAFATIVGFCFGLAIILFFIVTLISA